MKLLIAVLFSALALSAASVDVSFNYDFTGGQACSTSVTSNCFDHFEVGLLAGSALNTLVSIPLPANPTGQVNGIKGSFTLNAGFGQQTVSAVMVAKDGGGNRITSDPTKCTAQVVITPSAPAGLTVTFQ